LHLLRWNTGTERSKYCKINTTAALWVDRNWNTEWKKNTFCFCRFFPSAGPSAPKMTLLRPSWIRLNHLRAGMGLFVLLNNAQMGLGAFGKLQL